MVQPLQPPVQTGQNQPQSMNMNVSPEKRGALKNYMEGYKAAIESKTMNNLLPNISSPQQGMPPQGMGQPPMGMPPQMPPQGMMPPQMPQQPPMMPPQPYNYGGMVDVFEPRYMDDGGFVIQTDPSGKIATKSVFDEDRGRMVSQILSRDDMQRSAGGGGLAKIDNVIEDAVLGDVVENLSTKNFPDEVNISDPSVEMYYPQERTEIEPKISDIIGPESKPTVQDFLHDVTNVDEMRAIPEVAENVAVPLSKPSSEETVFRNMLTDFYADRHEGSGGLGSDQIDHFDEARRLIQQAPYEKQTKPFVEPKLNVLRSLIGEEDGGIEEYEDPEELRDAAEYRGEIPDYIGEMLAKRRLSPEGMKQIGRMVLEGEKLSGPESDIFDMPNYDVGIDEVFDPATRGVAGSDAPVVAQYPTKDRQSKLRLENIMKQMSSGAQPMTSSGEEEEQLSGLMEILKLNPQLFPFLNLAGESDEAGLMGGMLGLGLFPSARAKAENYLGLPENYIKSLDKKAGINFNNGGIVQGFGKGGAISNAKRKSDFSSNIGGNVSGRVRDIMDERDRLMELDYGSPVSAFDRVLQGNVGYDEGALDEKIKLAQQNVMPNYGGGEGQLSGSYTPHDPVAGNFSPDQNVIQQEWYPNDPPPGFLSGYPNTPPPGLLDSAQAGTMSDDGSNTLRIGEDEVESTGPVYDAFLKSQQSMFAPAVNKIGELMGKSPYDLYYTTQQTLKDDSMVSQIAKHRKLDQDRAERKLAEEQRLRDMIAGMLPPTAATPTPADPIVTPPVEDTTPPDYTSAVVPSDRIPGFDINKISPYPTFNVPGTPTAPAIIPSGITPELLRKLFEMQGVPATAMNRGGSVNTLDNAVDNFLGSLRSVA